MITTNVLPDSVLALHKIPPRKDWTPPQWLAFLNGWSEERLGFPRYSSATDATNGAGGFFAMGVIESNHFAAVAS